MVLVAAVHEACLVQPTSGNHNREGGREFPRSSEILILFSSLERSAGLIPTLLAKLGGSATTLNTRAATAITGRRARRLTSMWPTASRRVLW